MTERLYYTDSYQREFAARVVDRSADRVYLDRTSFYPASGGQLADRGLLGGRPVADVVDEGDRIAHIVEGLAVGDSVTGVIDWPRRFDHMQQHSGQHLLSAVFASVAGLETVSVHLGEETSTIDLRAGSIDREMLARVEDQTNETVTANLPLTVEFEDAARVAGLRKESKREGTLRIVSILGLDRSACGGTHVHATGEIGPVAILRTEKIRDCVRVEFLCGGRAVRRSRTDRLLLDQIGRKLSCTPQAAPDLIADQIAKIRELEKDNRRLLAVEADVVARRLYDQTEPDSDGLRRRVEQGPLDRLAAQSWCALDRTVYVGICAEPPSILIASSEDSGVDAGQLLRELISGEGGRGGGSPRLAQGSLPGPDALARLALRLR